MTEYVCGLMFSENGQNVLLIRKDRPEWQAGLLNGIGGKIDEEDTEEGHYFLSDKIAARKAMIREFREEVGLETTIQDWKLFAILEGTSSKIYYFKGKSDKIYDFKQMESEEPIVLPARDVWIHEPVPNLNFLIPMARLNTEEVFTILCEIKGGTIKTI